MSRVFFDSNVLVYTVTLDDHRRGIAQRLVAKGGVVSVQCLNEFVSVATRKLKMTWQQAIEARDELLTLFGPPLPLTIALHHQAVRLAERYKLSLYDALIAATALETGCDTLYSEDMHAGLVIDGRLTVVNPFA